MQVPVVTIEGNISVGKTTLLQTFELSLSGEDKITLKVECEKVKESQKFFMEMTWLIHWNTLK